MDEKKRSSDELKFCSWVNNEPLNEPLIEAINKERALYGEIKHHES